MALKIVRNDITKMKVDAIVNTANEAPIYSDGVDTAVYEAAGANELLAERRKIGYMNEGEVAITPGFNLPAQYIIHAVSPFYKDAQSEEEERIFFDIVEESSEVAEKRAELLLGITKCSKIYTPNNSNMSLNLTGTVM